MAQRLHPIKLIETRSIHMQSNAFRQGYHMGLNGRYRPGLLLPQELTEAEIVSIVENLCQLAQDYELTQERLHFDTGILCAWILSIGGSHASSTATK